MIQEVRFNPIWVTFTSDKQCTTFSSVISMKLGFSSVQCKQLTRQIDGSEAKWFVLLILENFHLVIIIRALSYHRAEVDFVPFLADLQDVWCAYLGTVNLLEWKKHTSSLRWRWLGLMRWHSGNEIRTEQCFMWVCVQCMADGVNITVQ